MKLLLSFLGVFVWGTRLGTRAAAVGARVGAPQATDPALFRSPLQMITSHSLFQPFFIQFQAYKFLPNSFHFIQLQHYSQCDYYTTYKCPNVIANL